jgi:trk system potassium uptake protein TrkA
MERIPVGAAELGVLAGMLRKVDFFAPLTIGQLETILPHVMLCRYEAGETVFRQGDAGEAFHIVYQGKVDIRLPRFLFLSKTIATLSAGQFFGEIALISAEPRTATVVCTEPTLLFTLLASDFAFVLRENPAAAQEMRSIADQRRFASKHAS